MSSQVIDLNPAEHLVVDAIGAPEEPLFLIQAHAGEQEIALLIDSNQAVALVDSIYELFDLLDKQYPRPINELELPHLGRMAPRQQRRPMHHVAHFQLAYQAESDKTVLIAVELQRVRVLEQEPRVIRLWMTREELLGIARRLEHTLVGEGLICPACGQPLGPDPHHCVRNN
jgi:uncharacterized repeat protein (TIGR03847 family)